MAGITQREREDKARIRDIKLKLTDPLLPLYLYAKLQGTLSGLQDKQDRRIAERKAALETARKARKPISYPNVLPSNGREPGGSSAPPAAPAFDLGAFLDKSGINRG
jgi:hypothetical protein